MTIFTAGVGGAGMRRGGCCGSESDSKSQPHPLRTGEKTREIDEHRQTDKQKVIRQKMKCNDKR